MCAPDAPSPRSRGSPRRRVRMRPSSSRSVTVWSFTPATSAFRLFTHPRPWSFAGSGRYASKCRSLQSAYYEHRPAVRIASCAAASRCVAVRGDPPSVRGEFPYPLGTGRPNDPRNARGQPATLRRPGLSRVHLPPPRKRTSSARCRGRSGWFESRWPSEKMGVGSPIGRGTADGGPKEHRPIVTEQDGRTKRNP